MTDPQFIDTTDHGRVQTVDGLAGLEIRPVSGVNPQSGKPYRQHNIVVLLNGGDKPELVGSYGTIEEAEAAYEEAAKCVTLEDALVVLDSRSLHLYGLHFSEPVSSAHTAQHYTGCTPDLKKRMRVHRRYSNSAIVRAAVDKGLEITVAWTRIGGWSEERHMKYVTKNGKKACPLCNGGK